MDSKEELRRFAKELRKNIDNKKYKEQLIAKKLLKNRYIIKAKNILVYVSKDDEVNTINLINELLSLKKNVYAPVVCGATMEFYKINFLSELKLSKLKILEPTSDIKFTNDEFSVCIIPGLLFDKNNNRLGYGCGYYDKYLSKINIYKIGICFSTFIVDNIKIDEHDIKMDTIITER